MKVDGSDVACVRLILGEGCSPVDVPALAAVAIRAAEDRVRNGIAYGVGEVSPVREVGGEVGYLWICILVKVRLIANREGGKQWLIVLRDVPSCGCILVGIAILQPERIDDLDAC